MIRQPQKDECIRLYKEGVLTIKEIMADLRDQPNGEQQSRSTKRHHI